MSQSTQAISLTKFCHTICSGIIRHFFEATRLRCVFLFVFFYFNKFIVIKATITSIHAYDFQMRDIELCKIFHVNVSIKNKNRMENCKLDKIPKWLFLVERRESPANSRKSSAVKSYCRKMNRIGDFYDNCNFTGIDQSFWRREICGLAARKRAWRHCTGLSFIFYTFIAEPQRIINVLPWAIPHK